MSGDLDLILLPDPDLAPSALRRRRLGNLLLTLGLLVLLPGLLAAGVLTAAGVVSGAIGATATIGAASLLAGALARAGTSTPALGRADLLPLLDPDTAAGADADLLAAQGRLAEELLRIAALLHQPRRRRRYAEELRAADRVAFIAARQLQRAADDLTAVVHESAEDSAAARARIGAAHHRTRRAVAALAELAAHLPDASAAAPPDEREVQERARRAAAMAELEALTERVRLRQDALHDLDRTEPQSVQDCDGGEL